MVADSPLPSSPPTATPRKSWEPHSISMAAFDPPKLMEAELPIEFGENWLLNQPISRPTSGKGYVRVVPKSVTWVDHTPSYSVMLKEGLASSVVVGFYYIHPRAHKLGQSLCDSLVVEILLRIHASRVHPVCQAAILSPGLLITDYLLLITNCLLPIDCLSSLGL